jgi:hypothetical protein
MAAHPIAHDEQAELFVDQVVVLVVLALPTNVRQRRKKQLMRYHRGAE